MLNNRFDPGDHTAARAAGLRAFLGPMPADKAAHSRADGAVMAGIMSGHAADHRALEATFG